MKTYKHKETGAVLLSDSVIAGDWELVTGQTSDMTVAEIKSKLADLGIEFDPQAKKAELLALLPV